MRRWPCATACRSCAPSDNLSEPELRQLGADCLARLALTEDYQEGTRAFIEKRAPRWTGR